jgi:cytokinesis protein
VNSSQSSLHPNKYVLRTLFDVSPNTVTQIGKLNVYRNTTDPEELAGLHLADRLMVQLIKIERLAPRIQGMLYKSMFEDTINLLEDGARKLIDASDTLLHAPKFKELMNVGPTSSILRLTFI